MQAIWARNNLDNYLSTLSFTTTLPIPWTYRIWKAKLASFFIILCPKIFDTTEHCTILVFQVVLFINQMLIPVYMPFRMKLTKYPMGHSPLILTSYQHLFPQEQITMQLGRLALVLTIQQMKSCGEMHTPHSTIISALFLR